ncbi:MAG TPA: DUF971 domain-containing protein [Terracidiphilus sp.]|nr:DUF971 domain-containing protein [Terracidiphilus sp.]
MSHEGIHFATQEELDRQKRHAQPLAREAVTPKKVRVLLSEGKGLEIDWADGHQSAWSFAFLRDACPCATCVDQRNNEHRAPGQPKTKTADLLPLYTPPAKPASAHAVGRYALQFNWLDGHTAGIFSWEYLRRECQCAECKLAAMKTHGTLH